MKRPSIRGGVIVALALALLSCSSDGHFSVAFEWEGGQPPANLPATLYMYGQITPVGSTQTIAVAGPNLYGPHGSLSFAAVPTGSSQLVATAQLKDSPGAAGQVLAYGLSDPFVLPPGKDVTVTIKLGLHPVLSVPSTGGINAGVQIVTPNNSGEVNLPAPVTLELFAAAGAVRARISNFPALPTEPAGGGTVDVPSLTPDPTTTPPAGFQAFRYTSWDLDAGLTDKCATGAVCNRSVYVYFLDSNGVASATSSASVIVNRKSPELVNPVATPTAAKLGDQISIVATPTEPLAQPPVPHVYLQGEPATEVPGFLTFQTGTVYTFQSSAVTNQTTNGTYFVQFDLVDVAGNMNTFPEAGVLTFTVDSVIPTISHVSTNAAIYSEQPGFNNVTLTFDVAESGATATATLNGQDMACPLGYQSSSPNFTCTYAIASTPGTSGPQPIIVTASDVAGNQDSTTTSVTFDFTPPVLTPTVAPNPANASSSPFLSVASSKPLVSASVSSIVPASGVTAAALTGGGTSWSALLTGANAKGSFAINVTGTDAVGHTSTASAQFAIDTIVPTITDVATDATTYSEVSPHNVITLTFKTAKQASTVTVSGGAASWNPCIYAAPSYTCTSVALTSALGTGNQTIEITAVDEAGNQSQASTSVQLDFTVPVLTPSVAPNPANASSSPFLSLASSKSLVSASVTSIAPATGLTVATLTGSGTSWSAALQGTGAKGTFTINVSGTDALGHVATANAPFTIDAIVPTITDVATDATTYSEVSPHNVITLTFNTAKQASTVAVSGGAASWNPCTYSAPTYTCTSVALTSALGSGNQTIAITAVDEAGNESQASTSVQLDFTVPVLTPSVAPNPANASSSPFLSVASSKSLVSASVASIAPATGVTAATLTGSGTSWSAALQGAMANGTFTITVRGTDALGHVATASAPFTIDAIVPTITNVATDARTYSEVSPHDVITLTFDTAKPAMVTVTGGAASWNPCSYAAPTYTCTSAVLTPALGSGQQTISITAADEVGNQSQASASIVLDFNAPVLTPSAAPSPANLASSPVLTIASSKPLTSASVDSISAAADSSGAVTAGAVTGSSTWWSAPLTGTGAAGTFTINVSGTDTLGHMSTASTTFVVDAVAPVVQITGTNGTTFSEVSPFNSVTVTFNTTKAGVPAAVTTVAATVDGIAMTCGTFQQTAPNYTCTTSRNLRTSDGSGGQVVVVTVTEMRLETRLRPARRSGSTSPRSP
jgi:hypothetical protein